MKGEKSEISLRRARMTDLGELAKMKYEGDVFHSELPIWPPECDMGEASRTMRRHLKDQRGTVFVATGQAGILVGFATAEVVERETVHEEYRRIGTIGLLFVREEWRGRGIGRMLVSACTERFDELGIKHLTLRSVVGNNLSERFWDSLSFEPKIYGRSTTVKEVKARLKQR
ncbi:MAG: GNAT family N-acetyltransferase [Methanobacteriota archaeon]